MSVIEQIVPDGFKQTEIGVIPEDWNVKTLDSITGGKRPISYGIVQTGPHVHDGIPCLRVLDIVNGTIKTENLIRTTQKISNAYKRTQLKENDLVIPLRGKVGEVGIIGKELVGANLTRGVALIALEGEFIPQFIKQALCSEGSQNRLLNSMNGSALQEISIGTLRSFKISSPERPEEQTAIANALFDVDALLTELEKLIAKKQAIKTATMQQLLTGKTRLPQFATYTEGTDEGKRKGTKPSELGEIPEDWDVVALADIGQTIIGLTYSPNDVYDYGTLVLRSSNVQKNTLAYENNVFVDMDLPDRVIVREGDILVCVRNGSRNLIGKCALIDKKAEGSAFGAFMSIYRTKQSKFIFYQFQSNIIQNQINEIMGATINQITNKDMASFKVPLPSEIEEQTAIATILSDMDNEIQTLEQRLTKTRQIKQGMMQQLLTGRTRLPFNKET